MSGKEKEQKLRRMRDVKEELEKFKDSEVKKLPERRSLSTESYMVREEHSTFRTQQRRKTECTFKPDLTATRGRSSKGPELNKINGVENMLARYKKAKRLKSEEKEAFLKGCHVNDGTVLESQRHFYTHFKAL